MYRYGTVPILPFTYIQHSLVEVIYRLYIVEVLIVKINKMLKTVDKYFMIYYKCRVGWAQR
jgi:hypothetical protein